MKFTVIGAGMAGLFAAAVLRDECDSVLERQSNLPNNHSALFRFKSSVVGDALNIPFRRVKVIKAVHSIGNPIADAVSYSLKTNGQARLRSIITAQGAIEERYIAPDDFIKQLRLKVQAPIAFDVEWDGKISGVPKTTRVISTIPMPTMAAKLGYTDITSKFRSVPGYVTTAKLRDTDLCSTVYIPDKNELAYRASITGDRLIVEYAFPGAQEPEKMMWHLRDTSQLIRHLDWVLRLFGMDSSFIVGDPRIVEQRYAKILPIDDNERKRFMLWLTEEHGIYSFGRFATWRPELQMDDLVNDLRVIHRLARGESTYNARRG